MNLREVERILRTACAGRIPEDYAKITAATAMLLADAIAEADNDLPQNERIVKVLGTLIGWLQLELGRDNAKELLKMLEKAAPTQGHPQ